MDTKAKIILDLVLSLNAGDSYYVDQRVDVAIEQYEKLVKMGIIVEEPKTDELPTTDVSTYSVLLSDRYKEDKE